jgi:hypothetical protein
MPMRVKVPDSCADLCLAKVVRALERSFGQIPPAARELGVPAPDLRRLTWAQPKLLEEALEELELAVIMAQSVVIEALYSDDPRRQMWASDKIMSSYLARNELLAPARRGRGAEAGGSCAITFRWAGADAKDEATLKRDGQTIAVPRYGGDPVRPPVLSTPSPPPLPKWPGPGGPPPLVANRYQPWSPPQLKAPLWREAESEPRRRLSRGGYR